MYQLAFLGLADAELYLLSLFCCRGSGKVYISQKVLWLIAPKFCY